MVIYIASFSLATIYLPSIYLMLFVFPAVSLLDMGSSLLRQH